MLYEIEWKPRAVRQFENLRKQDADAAKKVCEKVEGLADREKWQDLGVIPLTFHPDRYRLWVGNYRVLFDVWNRVIILDVREA